MSIFLKINFADTTFYKNKKILQIRLFVKIRRYNFSQKQKNIADTAFYKNKWLFLWL